MAMTKDTRLRAGFIGMSPSSMLLLLLPLVFAAVVPGRAPRSGTISVNERQTWTENFFANDFSTYGCRPIIFIFARATIEPGNMGDTVGPLLSNGLKAVFGETNVATEGVDYLAIPDTNFDPGGAPPFGIGLMQILLSAASECPNAKVLASGYSQGAALTHRAIEGLNSSVKAKIAGVVTFGDTQTLQDGGQIRGFDTKKTLIICNVGDVVCTGTLTVLPVHFDYVKWVPTALSWLIEALLTANKTTVTFTPLSPTISPSLHVELASSLQSSTASTSPALIPTGLGQR